MSNILIIIAARGGSKGIRGKNIKPLAGKPLIYYTIKQALAWKKGKRIVVSTDSEKISKIARRYGAEVPFVRPRELALDSAPKVPVLQHALRICENIFNEKYDIVVDLDVTSPVRTTEDLDKCLRVFRRFRPKTLFSVVKAHKNPYFNMVEVQKNDKVKLCKKSKYAVTRRQDAPKVYSLNAAIYFYRRDYLLNGKSTSLITDDSRLYLMPDICGMDIDSEIDFKFLEFLIKEGKVML